MENREKKHYKIVRKSDHKGVETSQKAKGLA